MGRMHRIGSLECNIILIINAFLRLSAYVIMLFDPPASEWIFNYRANNGFVTWQEFLDDVSHRFDPQFQELHVVDR